MNWAGFVFGASATVAVLGALIVTLTRGGTPAIAGFAGSMIGVAGICLTLGDDFLAILIVLVLSAALPAGMLAAVKLAPAAAARPRRPSRIAAAALLALGTFAGLVTLIARTPWPPAGGPRETGASWIGWGLLTYSVAAFELLAALIAVAAIGALVLARAATPPHSRTEPAP